ncbi:hypothetical protein Hanom_Chr03g00185091 [Helianthus anomalus]
MRYRWFKPWHFFLTRQFGIIVSQRRWTRLIPNAFDIPFQLFHLNDMIKHIPGVRITLQLEIDRNMLAFGNG